METRFARHATRHDSEATGRYAAYAPTRKRLNTPTIARSPSLNPASPLTPVRNTLYGPLTASHAHRHPTTLPTRERPREVSTANLPSPQHPTRPHPPRPHPPHPQPTRRTHPPRLRAPRQPLPRPQLVPQHTQLDTPIASTTRFLRTRLA